MWPWIYRIIAALLALLGAGLLGLAGRALRTLERHAGDLMVQLSGPLLIGAVALALALIVAAALLWFNPAGRGAGG